MLQEGAARSIQRRARRSISHLSRARTAARSRASTRPSSLRSARSRSRSRMPSWRCERPPSSSLGPCRRPRRPAKGAASPRRGPAPRRPRARGPASSWPFASASCRPLGPIPRSRAGPDPGPWPRRSSRSTLRRSSASSRRSSSMSAPLRWASWRGACCCCAAGCRSSRRGSRGRSSRWESCAKAGRRDRAAAARPMETRRCSCMFDWIVGVRPLEPTATSVVPLRP